MKVALLHFALLAALLGPGSALAQPQSTKEKLVPAGLERRIKQFFTDKEAHARSLAREEGQEQHPVIWEFFEAGRNGDWAAVAQHYRTLRRGAYQYENTKSDKRLQTMVWQPVNEAYGAYDQCATMTEKYATRFGQEIVLSMPRGSIYFGGTDPGRWLPTAFSKSHTNGDPCFVVTQNALADGLYLNYLRTMYGNEIATPTDDDSKTAFADYVADVQKRNAEGKLKPGEKFSEVNGKPQVSGQVAVMSINGFLVKTMFEENPEREFFVEESFPFDWMYPHLSPHGLIMKVNRKPLDELPAETLRKDRDYWIRLTQEALGKWLTPETSVEKLCEFATRVFGDKEAGDYKPDASFVNNSYACKTYSKLRLSQAGVYAWRGKNSQSPEEKARMTREADLAFRQAFALCPYSPEAVFRYVNHLVEAGRKSDALLVVETAEQLDPRNRQFGNLIQELREKENPQP